METIEQVIARIRASGKASNQKNPTQQELTTTTQIYCKCPRCNDTGFIIVNNSGQQPTIKKCKCLVEKETIEQIKRSGLNTEATKQTFSTFECWGPASKKMKETAIKYYQNFNSIKSNRCNSLMACGQVGSGKTHICIAIMLNLLRKGNRVVYMPYRDVITKLKQNMLDEVFYKKELNKYKNTEVLLIDDLYKGKITESDINIMFEIINHRYLNYLPIMVSTEFTIERLLDFDEAIGSRIYEMCKDYVIEIEGRQNNYRMR